jgi:hypothetical protein
MAQGAPRDGAPHPRTKERVFDTKHEIFDNKPVVVDLEVIKEEIL